MQQRIASSVMSWEDDTTAKRHTNAFARFWLRSPTSPRHWYVRWRIETHAGPHEEAAGYVTLCFGGIAQHGVAECSGSQTHVSGACNM